MPAEYINLSPRDAQAGDEYLSTSGWQQVASVAFLRGSVKITFEDGGTRTEPIRHLTSRQFRRAIVNPIPAERVVDELNEPVDDTLGGPTEIEWASGADLDDAPAPIEVGDYVKAEQTTGQAVGNPQRRVVEGVVYRDDEGTLRVERVNVTRDADGYFPAGVVVITHKSAPTNPYNPCSCTGAPDYSGRFPVWEITVYDRKCISHGYRFDMNLAADLRYGD